MSGIRGVSFEQRFRGLSLRPFEHVRMGKRTVIYGRNGSGKTTLSESLRDPASSKAIIEWADPITGPTQECFVFNRFYVQEALAEFVEGDGSAAAILKVGETNVRLAGLESTQRAANKRNERWIAEIEAEKKRLISRRDRVVQEMKARVIEALGQRDGKRFNSTMYTVREVKRALERQSEAVLSEEQFADACTVVGLEDVGARISVDAAPESPEGFTENLPQLFEYNPIAATIASLVSDAPMALWVEQGLTMHQAGEDCKFCADGSVSANRISRLQEHFSDDLGAFRARLDRGQQLTDSLIERLRRWENGLPDVSAFEPSLQRLAADATATLKAKITEVVDALEGASLKLMERKDNPFGAAIASPDLQYTLDVAPLITIAQESNAAFDAIADRRKAAILSIEDSIAYPRRSELRDNHERARRLAALSSLLAGAHSLGVARARSLHDQQQDTTAMAADIDDDLRSHFGHVHLAVTASADGKGYVVQRDGQPARTLSEGERNAVALAYFLRSLFAAGVDLGNATVVVDDPITSLDREAMFAAYALIQERTKTAGQVVLLTHDFEYFRLLLNGFSKQWDKSQKRILQGDADELHFPALSVLESRSLGSGAGRATIVEAVPSIIVKRASEYHYLFWRVGVAVRNGDPDNLPILGNAARRLLEGFISFRAPHGNNFQEKIDHVGREARLDSVLCMRVVKFLHGQSHREEARPTSSIDFPAVEAELSMALDFIKQADGNHYRNMCTATGITLA